MSFSIKKTKNTPMYLVKQNPPPETNLTEETDGSSSPAKNIPVKINTTSSFSVGRSHSIKTSRAKMTEDCL